MPNRSLNIFPHGPAALMVSGTIIHRDQLTVGFDPNLFERIKQLPALVLPTNAKILTMGKDGMPTLTNLDDLGNRLTFVYAREFRVLVGLDEISPRNMGIVEFIDKLPAMTPIVLNWG